MSLIKWNDSGLFPRFSSMMDNFFGKDTERLFANGVNVPAVNVRETEEQFLLELAAPGKKKEDFHIELENGVLTISSEEKKENKEEKENYTRQEFSYSSFSRSFTLPENVNTEGINAQYIDGLLKIALPKKIIDNNQLRKRIDVQ